MKRHLIMRTGEKGSFNFHTAMMVGDCKLSDNPFECMASKYRGTRDELYTLKKKYEKLRKHWLVRILIKLKIVKI